MREPQKLTLRDVVKSGLEALANHTLQAQIVMDEVQQIDFETMSDADEDRLNRLAGCRYVSIHKGMEMNCVVGSALTRETKDALLSSRHNGFSVGTMKDGGFVEIPEEDLIPIIQLQYKHDLACRRKDTKQGYQDNYATFVNGLRDLAKDLQLIP